jgi:hypothetical protein
MADDDFYDEAPLKVSLANGVYGLPSPNAPYYVYPPPPGIELPKGHRGWRRMTNLVSAFSDQKALQDWLTWKTMMGLRASDGLIHEEWMAEPAEHLEPAAQRELANRYADRAREAAGGLDAARRGTARHKMMDVYLATGVETGTRSMAAQRQSALGALEAHDLEVLDSEFTVWHPAAGGTVGRSDVKVLCRRTGQVGILDWKTQKRFWTFQEVCGQLCGYDQAPWIWRGPPTIEGQWIRQETNTLMGHPDGEFAGKRVALVAHMPQAPGPGQVPVQIMEVDLEYGAQVIAVAARNVELRSVGKSVAVGRRTGAIRPAQGVAPRAIAR